MQGLVEVVFCGQEGRHASDSDGRDTMAGGSERGGQFKALWAESQCRQARLP